MNVHTFTLNSDDEAVTGHGGIAVSNYLDVFIVQGRDKLLFLSSSVIALGDPPRRLCHQRCFATDFASDTRKHHVIGIDAVEGIGIP